MRTAFETPNELPIAAHLGAAVTRQRAFSPDAETQGLPAPDSSWAIAEPSVYADPVELLLTVHSIGYQVRFENEIVEPNPVGDDVEHEVFRLFPTGLPPWGSATLPRRVEAEIFGMDEEIADAVWCYVWSASDSTVLLSESEYLELVNSQELDQLPHEEIQDVLTATELLAEIEVPVVLAGVVDHEDGG